MSSWLTDQYVQRGTVDEALEFLTSQIETKLTEKRGREARIADLRRKVDAERRAADASEFGTNVDADAADADGDVTDGVRSLHWEAIVRLHERLDAQRVEVSKEELGAVVLREQELRALNEQLVSQLNQANEHASALREKATQAADAARQHSEAFRASEQDRSDGIKVVGPALTELLAAMSAASATSVTADSTDVTELAPSPAAIAQTLRRAAAHIDMLRGELGLHRRQKADLTRELDDHREELASVREKVCVDAGIGVGADNACWTLRYGGCLQFAAAGFPNTAGRWSIDFPNHWLLFLVFFSFCFCILSDCALRAR